MEPDLEQIGLDAVDRFISTWNARDPGLWATSLNYPHVRPSPFGTVVVAKNAAEYAAKVDFSKVIETGWDHSEWDYRQVIHTSPDKIHVAGQWSRYDVRGKVIHTNPVVYIVTLVEGTWGIQSRFGSDYADDDDTTGLETRAFRLIDDFINHFNNNNAQACSGLLNYPHYEIGIGQLREHLGADQFTITKGNITIDSLQALQTGKRSLNAGLDITMQEGSGTQTLQAVVNITVRDDHLGIQGWSLMNTNTEEEKNEEN